MNEGGEVFALTNGVHEAAADDGSIGVGGKGANVGGIGEAEADDERERGEAAHASHNVGQTRMRILPGAGGTVDAHDVHEAA